MNSLNKHNLSAISLGIALVFTANTNSVAAPTVFKWSSESAHMSSGSENGFMHVNVSRNKNSGSLPGPIIVEPPLHSDEMPTSPDFAPRPPMDETHIMIHHSDMENGLEGSYFGVIDKNEFEFEKNKASVDSYVCVDYREMPVHMPPMPPMPEPIPTEPMPEPTPEPMISALMETAESSADIQVDHNMDSPPPPVMDEPIPPRPPFPPTPPPVIKQVCGDITLTWEVDGLNYHKNKSQGEDIYGGMLTKRKSKSSGGSASVSGVFLGEPLVMEDPHDSHGHSQGGLNSYSSVERFFNMTNRMRDRD